MSEQETLGDILSVKMKKSCQRLQWRGGGR